MSTEQAPRTVRVRIAVAVDPSGKWIASGWSETGGKPADKIAMDVAVDGVDPGEARYWIEATLPIPAPPVIEGEVKPA